ncbi:MAG: cupin domain-containing protein [Oscillospiraceae bacterium]|nr:cupin domain-containing protein [Oscillospiraceae bacterium]
MSDHTLEEINLALGAKIRRLRTEHGYKISDLAEMTGLTSSMISQLERGLISPSIATLKKVCGAMQIPISYLFEEAQTDGRTAGEPTNPILGAVSQIDFDAYLKLFPPANLMGVSPVVHKSNRKFLSPGKGIRFYLLNPNLSGPIEFIYNEYDPGASTGRYSHPGSECGLMLSGALTVEVNDQVYLLEEGDSITFNSSDPHLKRNDSDRMCTCVWANVPPWF